MGTIVTLVEYQAATDTVAVYPGSDPAASQAVTAALAVELMDTAKQVQDDKQAQEGLRLMLSLMGAMKNAGLMYTSLGLAGEAGEFCDKVKKMLRDSGGAISEELKESLAYELGDILWYVAQSAKQLGLSMEQVANMNMKKLWDRQARNVLGGSGDTR